MGRQPDRERGVYQRSLFQAVCHARVGAAMCYNTKCLEWILKCFILATELGWMEQGNCPVTRIWLMHMRRVQYDEFYDLYCRVHWHAQIWKSFSGFVSLRHVFWNITTTKAINLILVESTGLSDGLWCCCFNVSWISKNGELMVLDNCHMLRCIIKDTTA